MALVRLRLRCERGQLPRFGFLGHTYHLTRLDQYEPLSLPFAIPLACLALKLARLAASALLSPLRGGEPLTPCCPKRISLTVPPSFASTT